MSGEGHLFALGAYAVLSICTAWRTASLCPPKSPGDWVAWAGISALWPIFWLWVWAVEPARPAVEDDDMGGALDG